MGPQRGVGVWALISILGASWGCGGPGGSGGVAKVGTATPEAAVKTVKFVGFDASGPLVEALERGEIQGLVLQDPFRMGELSVRTLVDHLEKKPVEAKISTGETLATPETFGMADVQRLVHAPKEHSKGGVGAAAKAKKWRVMVIPKGLTHEHWQTVHAGVLAAAEELGNVEVIWLGPEKESDRAQQVQLVRTAIGTGVDGIVLAPLDSEALVAPVEEAIAKGIGVVIFDSALNSTKTASLVATNNYHGGVLAAQRLGEVLGGEGKIIMLRYMVNSASTDEREKGFEDTIAKEFPKITYLSKGQYAGATADTAQKEAQNLVARYRGQVDGIYCPNESSTFGMLRALQDAGMVKPSGKTKR